MHSLFHRFTFLIDSVYVFLYLVCLWLPPYDECPKFFLGQILTNKKMVLNKKDVPRSTAPKWPELAINDLWPRIQNNK